MKEKITEILKKYEDIELAYQYDVATEEEALKNKATPENIADEIMELVNQEVEKRIAERQLTDEQIERQFTTSHYHYEKGHYYKVRKDRIFGAKWYRSRLVSQKTEGGE